MTYQEFILEPETESGRDLLYAERSSCDRAIHVLIHEVDAEQRSMLLAIYREIVNKYLSMSDLKQPVEFLGEFQERIESLADEWALSLEDFLSAGFAVLLRATDGYYVLTSSEDFVRVRQGPELTPLASFDGVVRVRSATGVTQEELFPQHVRDALAIYRADITALAGLDVVVGSGPADAGAVIEALQDPAWKRESGKRVTIVSRLLRRRVLALRLGPAVAEVPGRRPVRQRGQARRLVIGTAAVALLVTIIAMGFRERDDRADGPQTVASGVDSVAGEASVTSEAVPMQESLALGWRHEHAEAVTSSPLLVDNLVVYGARDGFVYARERASGVVAWKTATGSGIGASPAAADGRVYIGNYDGEVLGLRLRDGGVDWRRKLPGRISSSPVVAQDRVIIGCYDGFAYCLALDSGKVLWKRKTGARIRATGAVSRDAYFVPSYDGFLYALALSDGTVRWRAQLKGQLAATPVVVGETVVMGAPDGQVAALGVSDGRQRWRFRADGAVKSSLMAFSGRLYFGSNDRQLYCVNVADGNLLWRFPTGDIVLARAAVDKSSVYVPSYDGVLYCLDARDGHVKDRFEAGSPIFSSPAVDGDGVYFGTNGGSFLRLNRVGADAS